MADLKERSQLISLAADIVSAYVANNSVPIGDLSSLISDVHRSLTSLSDNQAEPSIEAQKPAVPVRKSVHSDYIVCLEDGKRFRSLKRHLNVHYGMSPDEYRAKWKLPADYPMVAPDYAAARSALAKSMGLGRKKAKTPEPPPARQRRRTAAKT